VEAEPRATSNEVEEASLMPSDPYYETLQWRQLRAARLKLDRNTCVVPGSSQRGTTVAMVGLVAEPAGSAEMRGLRTPFLYRLHETHLTGKVFRDSSRAVWIDLGA
jgi:hypothetical protein